MGSDIFKKRKLTRKSTVSARKLRAPDILEEIYRDKNGELINLGKIERKQRGLSKLLIVLAIFSLLAGLSLAGFFIFSPKTEVKFGEEMVDLSVSAPSKIIPGEKFLYTLEYRNRGEIALKDIELSFYPALGFVPETEGEGEQTWKINKLGAGETEQKTIEGFLFGRESEEKTARLTMLFKPEGFKVEFRKSTSATSSLLEPAVNFSYKLPSEIIIGEDFSIPFTLKNNSSNDLQNIALILTIPEDLILGTADPEFSKTLFSEATWVIDLLPANAEWQGIFTGQLKRETASGLSVLAKTGLISGNETFIIDQEEIQLSAHKEDLLLKVFINGSEADNAVNFSDRIAGTIVIKNRGETEIQDIELQAEILEQGGELVVWDKFESTPKTKIDSTTQNSQGRLSRIVLTKKEIKVFSVLKPDNEAAFDFYLPLVGVKNVSSLKEDAKITTTASVKIKKEGKEKTIVSNTLSNALNSDFAFNIEGRYFSEENIPLGTGPLPPEVGKETSLRILLTINNNLHDLKDVEANIALGADVMRVNRLQVDAGEIVYNENSKGVAWSLNRLPKGINKVEGSFEVVILPQEKDLGKILTLITSSSIKAVDQKTTGQISLRKGPITSDLEDDPQAKGKGVVIKK